MLLKIIHNSPAFQITVLALPHFLPYLWQPLPSLSLCFSYSIICSTRPVFLPFFSFTLFHINIPDHLFSFTYFQTLFLLPFSVTLCPDKVSLYPFTCMCHWQLDFSASFFQSSVLDPEGTSSPLLASERTISSKTVYAGRGRAAIASCARVSPWERTEQAGRTLCTPGSR